MKKLIILLLVACLSATVANAAMRKGPYLIYPGTNTEMMVLWQLTATRQCTLEWGLDTWYSTGSTTTDEYSTGADGHQHKYTITGLTPGTKYYYQVIEDANHQGSFYAAPPETAKSVKFFAYGDGKTGGGEHNIVNGVMIDTYKADPNYQTFTIYTGDWVTAGEFESDWDNQHFNRSMPNNLELHANLPINGCMGNHEWDDVKGTLFDKYYPYPYPHGAEDANLYYSFDYGPALIVAVDQYAVADENVGSVQWNWLKNELATTDKEWKFIQFHEPGYAAGGGHPDDWDVRDYIQPLCEIYGVDIVFMGHNHYYARCIKNGVTYITTGAAGTGLANAIPNYSPYVQATGDVYHSFCKIAIDGDQLELTAVYKNGTVIESFTLSHRCFAPTLPWSDGFEDVNSYPSADIGGGWDISNPAYVYLQGVDVNTGSSALETKKAGWVQRAISTEGFTDIHVKYARKTVALDVKDLDEYLYVEWSVDNINWTILEQTRDTSWASMDMTCDANANDNPGFRVRFRLNADRNTEFAWVDTVEITGTPIYAAGDFDATGSVGFYDLDIFTDQWLASCTGQPCCDECDIDDSGRADFNDFAYLAGNWAPDTTAPTPDPMTWDTLPQPAGEIGETTIEMVANIASDGSGVEYFFDCTTGGGHDSGWQESTSYMDTGLTPDTSYTYQVKAHDLSPNRNETAFSTAESANTDPCDSTAPTPSPMTFATAPYPTVFGESTIAMVATTATDAEGHGVEYYFDETTGGPGATDSGWQDGTSYEDTKLTPNTQYTYHVKARDKSLAQNETIPSGAASATTDPLHTDPPTPDPMTWDTEPFATGNGRTMKMIATTASDPYGVEYFFDCNEATSGLNGDDSVWQESPTYEDTGLMPGTYYEYRVKARDQSISQNETAYSSSVRQITPLFRDSFPDDLDPPWVPTGSVNVNYQCKDCGEPENDEGANLTATASMELPLSTVGFNTIVVKYDRLTVNYDAGEYLTVKWSDDGGSNWTQLEQTQDTSCNPQTYNLGSTANNNNLFRLKFSTNADGNQEYACVDNVEVWGTPIP